MNRKFIYIGCTVFAMSLLSMTGCAGTGGKQGQLSECGFRQSCSGRFDSCHFYCQHVRADKEDC